MPTSWYDPASLQADIAAAMTMDDASEVGERWAGISANACNDAQTELENFWQGVGYTRAQIDSWDVVEKQSCHLRMYSGQLAE